MSIDGTYHVIINSSMGNVEGQMTYETQAGVTTGRAMIMGNEITIPFVQVTDDHFIYPLKVKTPLGRMNIIVTGTVTGDRITGKINSSLGNFPFQGERM